MRTRTIAFFGAAAASMLAACTAVLGSYNVNDSLSNPDSSAPDATPGIDGGRDAAPPSNILNDAISVSAGKNHTCAVRANGNVVCWGDNGRGQLATPSLPSSDVPVPSVVQKAKQVFSGNEFSCALDEADALICWGRNDCGQLGRGATSPQDGPGPVVKPGAAANTPAWNEVSTAALGSDFACAVDRGGTANCWGCNPDGQLGFAPQQNPTPSPKPVAAVTDSALTIAVAAHHACGVFDSQPDSPSVWCWGRQEAGEVGAATNGNYPPIKVAGDGGIGSPKMVATGRVHSCAVDTSVGQRAVCWGSNELGQSSGPAAGPGVFQNVPKPVANLSGVVQVEAGEEFTCARRNDGSVACWGRNDEGQLGIGSADGQPHGQPSAVPNIRNASAISLGQKHACALVKDDPSSARPEGRVLCWGWNAAGQIGDGSRVRKESPVQVVSPR